MKCKCCGKEITPDEAFTCESCGSEYCVRCASGLVICDCYGDFRRYS